MHARVSLTFGDIRYLRVRWHACLKLHGDHDPRSLFSRRSMLNLILHDPSNWVLLVIDIARIMCMDYNCCRLLDRSDQFIARDR